MTLTVNGITKSPPYKIDAGSFNMKDIVKLDDKTGQRMRAMEDQLKSMDPMGRKKKLDELSQVVEGTGTVVTIQLSTKDETTPNQANCEQSEALQPNSPANKRKAQLENPQQIKKPKVNHQRDPKDNNLLKLPEFIPEEIKRIIDVRGDGHCGYPVVAHFVKGDEKDFGDIQRDLVKEIKA
ncbi:hypothetical protein PSHT_12297 [Puccinia striiformis]|uniref:OTU domain-containing protein n=3 Tax=Puccinia striiformis TaxID=27350 RepID=A0A2S4UXX6_9BASI|nr:hypothetical protein PSHT_12297 [Puccinia striiformis]